MGKTAINFTKATLAALPTPAMGKRSYFQDSKTRGLMFAITDRGTRSYVFYRKIEGRPERILIGRFDDLSIEQARNRAAEFNAMVATGKNPAEHKRAARVEMTLGDLFDEFMKRHAKLHVKYHHQYEAQFRMHFRAPSRRGAPLASRKVTKVSRADLTEIHDGITANGQPITANRILSMISSVFSWGLRAGLIEANPALGIRKNSERGHQRDRFLQTEEMPYFFQAVAAHPSEIIRDYVMLSLLTGQRQANVLAMEWSELDLSNAIWRIPRSKTKTTREYVVPLVSEVIEILQRRGEAVGPFSRFVLPGSGKTGHLAEAKSGWKRILLRAQLLGLMDVIAETKGWSKDRTEQERKVAELSLPEAIETYRGQVRALNVDPDKFIIKDLRMHDLRRTLASWQAITGANLVAISKTLNHSNIATTGIYARMQIDPVRQAISTAAGAMFEAGGVGKVAPVINLPQGDRNPIAA